MSIAKKIIVTASLATVAVVGYNYVKNLNRANTELEVVPSASIHNLNFSGLIVRIDVKMKNPTKGSFNLQFPFIKLIYNESTVGTSQVIDQSIKLPPFGSALIDSIMIEIPLSGLLSSAYSVAKDVAAGKGVKMKVKTITTIDLGWKTLPYEKTDEIIIKKDPKKIS